VQVDIKTIRGSRQSSLPRTDVIRKRQQLFLPGALLVSIQAQLLAPFMFVNLCLTAFFK
jgi:hypothetical protein